MTMTLIWCDQLRFIFGFGFDGFGFDGFGLDRFGLDGFELGLSMIFY